ncbi:MAG: hypothetical protein ACYTA3_07285 [Planctomycetota bacterium]|jgi:hypothetical protein
MATDKPISVLVAAADPLDGWSLEILDPNEPLAEDRNKRVTVVNLRASKQRFTETSHGFAVLDVVGHDGANWIKAQSGTQAGDGIVLAVDDVDTFVLGLPGIHIISSHGLTLVQKFLSGTVAGGLADAPPVGGPVQRILKPLDTNTLLVQIGDYL